MVRFFSKHYLSEDIFPPMVRFFLKHYLRGGHRFRDYLRELESTEKYTPGELDNYQNEKLQKIIRAAYEGVPYYNKIFHELKLTPEDIKTKGDLHKLPIINKETVRQNFGKFRNTHFRGLVFKALTSGYSGSPSVFLRDMQSANFENAVVWRYLGWHGKSYGTKRAFLRGHLIVPAEKNNPPYWKEDPFAKELWLSSYHLSEKTLPEYVDVIRRWGYCDLYAYPSMAYLVADFCRTFHTELQFSNVFTSSEKLLPHQRSLIERTFHCEVADWYGNAERVAAIGQCEKGSYHEIADYSIVEYAPLDDGGYEIIGTGLHNHVMPLIRYSLGDVIDMDETDERCSCGRSFKRIKQIVGRQTDYIKTPEGRRISVINLIPWGLDEIREMQIVQNKIEALVVNIVTDERYNTRTADKLNEALRRYISPQMTFIINKVPFIQRTSACKYRVIIQNIKDV